MYAPHLSSGRGRRVWSPALAGLAALVLGGYAAPLLADSHPELRGSHASLDRQNRIAREHDFTYLRSRGEVRDFASQGYLVRIQPTADFKLLGVSFPYARPEVDVFLRRLASQYRSSCGEPLIVTSLTRPTSQQPANASDRSVHPTGMAIDVRYSRRASCRRWLENVLVTLEGAGVLEATRERYPRHYHVAVFPRQYAAYVEGLESATVVASAPDWSETGEYRVRAGDSLWDIARAHGTTVSGLRAANELRGSRIRAGQTLMVPAAVATAREPEAPAQVAAAESTGRSAESRAKPRVVTASVVPSVSDVVAALAKPAPTEEKPSTYQVRSGDSLWDIAREHGTTVRSLRQANRLRGNRIQAGQVLHMKASPAAATRRRAYRVRSGDSLWDIARAHGTTVRELRRVNDLPGSRIFVGQILEVSRPSGSRVRSSAASAEQP